MEIFHFDKESEYYQRCSEVFYSASKMLPENVNLYTILKDLHLSVESIPVIMHRLDNVYSRFALWDAVTRKHCDLKRMTICPEDFGPGPYILCIYKERDRAKVIVTMRDELLADKELIANLNNTLFRISFHEYDEYFDHIAEIKQYIDSMNRYSPEFIDSSIHRISFMFGGMVACSDEKQLKYVATHLLNVLMDDDANNITVVIERITAELYQITIGPAPDMKSILDQLKNTM